MLRKQVASATQEATAARREAQRLAIEVERLEGILRATGERAAAAEAQASARGEAVTQLYAQMAALRERYHAELSELKAARAGAAEAHRMRERLDSVQLTNDSLVAARCEGHQARLSAHAVMQCVYVYVCVPVCRVCLCHCVCVCVCARMPHVQVRPHWTRPHAGGAPCHTLSCMGRL